MRLEDLIRGLEIREARGSLDRVVEKVCFDSREVSRGALFVALRGGHRDGHAHLREAVERGAAVLVVERPPDEAIPALALSRVEGPVLSGAEGPVTLLRVPDTRRALALLAANFFGNPAEALHLIGVTGTNGKTTLTYLIRSILEEAGEPCGVIGTVSYADGRGARPATYTTPEPLELHGVLRKMADDGCRFVAMEVSSHALALERVHGCRFDTAVFTNLTRDHLDFHADMEHYFQAKARLF
ncbi:MAG: UDP-N-acetylmuramoyl-L-alanyl-D-glutamate--2,6-diaminopimelate ligase, partial [Nitrospirae bacterium]|nr:UDP-N-acetylmuramoyl-L-alanyl-D-glutamate--2,6-diaminopimelate ligase [Nitrospirota bacterium]